MVQYLRSHWREFKQKGFEWLHNFKVEMRQLYEQSLADGMPWNLNLLIDETQPGDKTWDDLFDPEINNYFGKYGLP